MTRWLTVPIIGMVKCYTMENVPQDLWESGEWRGYVESADTTYYETPDGTWFAVKRE